MNNETTTLMPDCTKQIAESTITIFLYYDGDYAMKYENLTRLQADELLLKWNSIEYPGWLAIEQ